MAAKTPKFVPSIINARDLNAADRATIEAYFQGEVSLTDCEVWQIPEGGWMMFDLDSGRGALVFGSSVLFGEWRWGKTRQRLTIDGANKHLGYVFDAAGVEVGA